MTFTGCVPPSCNNASIDTLDVPVKYRPKFVDCSTKQLLITLLIADVRDFLHITWQILLPDTGRVIPREGDKATGLETVIFITKRIYRTLRSICQHLPPGFDVKNITPRSGHLDLTTSQQLWYSRARVPFYTN